MGILGRHGKGHKPAVPVLLRVLEDPPEGMWNGTGKCVEMLVGLGAKVQVIPLLIRMLDPKLRGPARDGAKILGTFGKDAAPALPKLRILAEKAEDRSARGLAKKAVEQIEVAMKK